MRIYSALVDDKEKYIKQAIYLVWSLTQLAGVSKDNIVLHYTGKKVDHRLSALDVEIVPVNSFHPELNCPWCNKLNQFSSLLNSKFNDFVLLDCDTAVIKEPPVFKGALAKPVNYSNPKLPIQIKMFQENNLSYDIINCDINGLCLKGNINGGVVILDRITFENIYEDWYNYSLYCIKNLSSEDKFCSDQMSFAMALSKNNTKYETLDRKYNFSIHPWMKEELDCLPCIIHYNWFYDDKHMLQPMREGFKNANKVIEFLNNKWYENI
jgi:hypothetical protein